MAEKLPEDTSNFIFLTCGNWDIKTMLPMQLAHHGLSVPHYFQWINVKRPFMDITRRPPSGMLGMLRTFNLKLEGRHHSGTFAYHAGQTILTKLRRH
jgi:ERI1 exoribonuclease 3